MGRFARTSLALQRKEKEAFGPTGSVIASFRFFGRSISNLQRICPIYRLIWLITGPIFDRWLRTPCPVQCNIRKWNTAALTGTIAKHVQKPPVTMAKYVRKPTDREGTSFAVDIVRLTDEKRRCPVRSTTLNVCACTSKIRKMKDSCSDRDNGKARAKTERCGGFLFGVPSTPSIWCVLPQCMHTSARAVSTSTWSCFGSPNALFLWVDSWLRAESALGAKPHQAHHLWHTTSRSALYSQTDKTWSECTECNRSIE